ncbi:MAG TPA: HlyD family type I secretion periplasmic adaptor subunit, partial [Gammaproteobacteria bacterium]|nr:HlyD family type I secretion periplasmic adaptor subunit [Gammaproteobacteria bacterium]
NIVAVARGKLVPAGQVKVVQPLGTGVVRAIRVKEGERVAPGQVLVELDPTVSEADLGRLRAQLQAARMDRTRLLGLLRRAEAGSGSGATKAEDSVPFGALRASAVAGATPAAAAQAMQKARLETRWRAHTATLRALDSTMASKRAELAQVRAALNTLERTVPLATSRAEAVKHLMARQLASRQDWLALEQRRIEGRQALVSRRAGVVRLRAEVRALEQRRVAADAGFKAKVLADLARTGHRIQGLEKEMLKARRRAHLQRLRAPVAGVVQQLAVHTVGGVVTAAQPLMEIVPADGELEVEAQLANRDVGFVHAGQPAQLKVDAFPFTRYGVLPAEVTHISSDALQDGGDRLVFGARARLKRPFMRVEGRQVRLMPGMAVTLEVNTGRRRLIGYLLSPLLRHAQEAARER